MTPTEKHRETAKDIAFDFDCDWTADGRRRGETEEQAAIEAIATALANAEREGMKRAAEIARAAGKTHLDFAALGLPIEPSKIIAEDRARVASKIADRILSEAGEG